MKMENFQEQDKVTEATETVRKYLVKEYHRRFALLKTSWSFQTRQFFDNTTLHGVRYINEPNRPFCEKFMWFVFTSVGAVATMVVIVALWEKFQNHPTLTGLDTNYHSWEVKFPAITICPLDPVDNKKVDDFRLKIWGDKEAKSKYKDLLRDIANMSYYNLQNFRKYSEKINFTLNDLEMLSEKINSPVTDFRDLQEQLVLKCENFLQQCIYKGKRFNCCKRFVPFPTENGFCYSFNSRHAHTLQNGSVTTEFKDEQIDEMDPDFEMKIYFLKSLYIDRDKWKPHIKVIRIYAHSAEEIPIVEIHPLHTWRRDIGKILFSDKETYTTADSRQLTIKQRKCVFPEEIPLDTDSYYTFSGCMVQCRIRYARKKCNCIPSFYRPIRGYDYCDLQGLGCLAEFSHMFEENGMNCDCTFACLNHIYELEKLQDVGHNTGADSEVVIGFVSWPMVRYKKEVLFGWVDLLVSFGGIAGLFLGFSLLSGVECVYYFLLRSVCMTFRNVEELEDLQYEYDKRERDILDLSLVPTFCRSEKDMQDVIKIAHNKEIPLILKPKTYHQIHTEEKSMGITDRIRYQE